MTTFDPIVVKILLQHHYIFLIPVYKLVISDKILFFIVTPWGKGHPVPGFAYRSVVVYIFLMRCYLTYQDFIPFNINQGFITMTSFWSSMTLYIHSTKISTALGVSVWAWNPPSLGQYKYAIMDLYQVLLVSIKQPHCLWYS